MCQYLSFVGDTSCLPMRRRDVSRPPVELSEAGVCASVGTDAGMDSSFAAVRGRPRRCAFAVGLHVCFL